MTDAELPQPTPQPQPQPQPNPDPVAEDASAGNAAADNGEAGNVAASTAATDSAPTSNLTTHGADTELAPTNTVAAISDTVATDIASTDTTPTETPLATAPEPDSAPAKEPEPVTELAATAAATATASAAASAPASTAASTSPQPAGPAFAAPDGATTAAVPPLAVPSYEVPSYEVPSFGAMSAAYLDPAVATAEQIVEKAHRRAQRRRSTLRWTSALVGALVIGGAISWAISLPQRTNIPGLRTAADGRYQFPALTMPSLPPGQPAPEASDNETARRHLADIRKLLLPKPVGATTDDSAVDGSTTDGWLADPASLFAAHASAKADFAEYGLRHAATESWNTPDGATTTIYLLQFIDEAAANTTQGKLTDLKLTADMVPAPSLALASVPSGATANSLDLHLGGLTADYTAVKADGKMTRYGTLIDGDTMAIVVQGGPANLPMAPFTQVMTLQAQMLQ